jgi:hypothetical protein
VVPIIPNERPWKTIPSSRISTAGTELDSCVGMLDDLGAN